MDHRALVLSARKKAKFAFLALPEDVQDEVIEGLDGHALTLEKARDFLRERGYTLSHEAIAGYYRAVRRERRIHDAGQELTRMFEAFSDQPLEENVRALTNFLVATAAQHLADGRVGIKDVDLARVIGAMAKMSQTPGGHGGPPLHHGESTRTDAGASDMAGKDRNLSTETLRKIREEIYGIV